MGIGRGVTVAAGAALLLSLATCAGPTAAPTAASGSPPAAPTTPAQTSDPWAGVLLPDGVGSARFGDPVSEVLPAFIASWGEPDRDETIRSHDLYGYLAEPGKQGTLRQVAWDPLTVVFLDTTGNLAQEEIPFVAWHSGWTEGTRPFTTPEGVGAGSTLEELEKAFGAGLTVPDELGGPCGISWVFEARMDEGSYDGAFEERPANGHVLIASIGAGQPPSC